MKQVKPILKGIAAGAAVGTICYCISCSSVHQRKALRKNAGKALRAAGAVIDGMMGMVG